MGVNGPPPRGPDGSIMRPSSSPAPPPKRTAMGAPIPPPAVKPTFPSRPQTAIIAGREYVKNGPGDNDWMEITGRGSSAPVPSIIVESQSGRAQRDLE